MINILSSMDDHVIQSGGSKYKWQKKLAIQASGRSKVVGALSTVLKTCTACTGNCVVGRSKVIWKLSTALHSTQGGSCKVTSGRSKVVWELSTGLKRFQKLPASWSFWRFKILVQRSKVDSPTFDRLWGRMKVVLSTFDCPTQSQKGYASQTVES